MAKVIRNHGGKAFDDRALQPSPSVASLRSSEGSQAWLSAAKRFHRYTPPNLPLDASYVAGLRTWRELGYRVRRPERGILILCPRPYRVRDEQTGEEERRVSFRNGYVFDRSQVEPIAGEAKPLAPPEPAPVEGDSHAHLVSRLQAFAGQELGFAIERRELHGAALGVCWPERRLIALQLGQSANAELAVLAHEIAHALGIGYRSHGRERAECIVECATYMAIAKAGLDVEAASLPYIASWAVDGDDVIERDAAEIERIAARLERALERREPPGGAAG